MEAGQQIKHEVPSRRNLKKAAKVALALILLNVIGQLTMVYRTRNQLESPFIPESLIWTINKQFIFQAIVSAVVSLIALLLYYFDKYLLVMTLVVLTFIASRFLYV